MKSKIVYVLLIVLVLINAFLLFMLLKKPHERKQTPGDFLISELRFSDAQIEKFEALKYTHRQEMRSISNQMKPLKDQLFDFKNKDIDRDSIVSLIGDLEAKRDLKVYTYFNNLRNICIKNQKRKFDRLIRRAMHRGRKRPPKRK